MINMKKYMEAILKSQRYQKIAKERHRRINKTIITNFDPIILRILLISNMIMEEERTRNAGKANNWDTGSKKNVNFAISSCGMSIHRWPHSAIQPLKTLDFSGQLKMVFQVKGPYERKNTRWLKKGNMRLSIVHYDKWSYPNNNDVLDPIFLKILI